MSSVNDSEESYPRLRRILPFLRSPVDGSELSLDSRRDLLCDSHRNTFQILDGVPVLIPGLDKLLSDHFSISRAKGNPHPVFARTYSEILQAVASGGLTAYVLGFRFVVKGIRKVKSEDSSPMLPVASLYESQDGRPLIMTSHGPVELTSFRFEQADYTNTVWSEFRSSISVPPPYLLLEERIADIVFSNYYEIIPFLTPPTPPPRPGKTRPFDDAETRALIESNIPYYEWMFSSFGIDIENRPMLDIGCGGGWLVSVFERLGAKYPIGTDIRLSGLGSYLCDPSLRNGFLFMADMFQWCYAPGAFSFISVRNNSAIAKASALDGQFLEFGRGFLRSLAPGGLAYVSYVSDESRRRSEAGFSNLPSSELLSCFGGIGGIPLKTMKLGSAIALLVCRPEDRDTFSAKVLETTYRQRFIAFRDYVGSPQSYDDRILRNFFLAVSDFVSDIAREVWSRGYSKVSLWGSGILGYYTWRMLNIFYPHVSVCGFVLPETPAKGSVFEVLNPQAAIDSWGGEHLKVLVDFTTYEERVSRFPSGFVPDLVFFDYGTGDRPFPSTTFQYHFLSGDHDTSLPPGICRAYLQGRLKAIGEPSMRESSHRFEQDFLHKFPIGFKGVE